MKDKCLHKHIKTTLSSRYIIDKGWEWLQEQDDIDMSVYFIQEDQDNVVCEDCGEVLG